MPNPPLAAPCGWPCIRHVVGPTTCRNKQATTRPAPCQALRQPGRAGCYQPAPRRMPRRYLPAHCEPQVEDKPRFPGIHAASHPGYPGCPISGSQSPVQEAASPMGASYPLAIVRSPRPGNCQPSARSSLSHNVSRGQPGDRRATRPATQLHTITQALAARSEPSARGPAHMNTRERVRWPRDACTVWGAAHTTCLPTPYRVT